MSGHKDCVSPAENLFIGTRPQDSRDMFFSKRQIAISVKIRSPDELHRTTLRTPQNNKKSDLLIA
jgi:hypothetical protein